MELLQTIKTRRSIRQFKNNKLTKKQISDILNCGRLAPSAKNRQPWRFVVVRGKNKDKIAQMVAISSSPQNEKRIKEVLKSFSSISPTAEAIAQCDTLILILKQPVLDWSIGDNLSIGACVQNMCLRATDLGLGCLWIRDTVYAQKEILQFINKTDMELSCALALGIANENPPAKSRNRLQDITEWI